MRWWLGVVAKLYPKAWRERYGVEFACLLDGVDPRWTDVVDVLRGAAMIQLRTLSSYLRLVGAVAVAGVIVALVASFVLPGLYVSSAVIQAGSIEDPQTSDRIRHTWEDVTSRSSLSELIQRPKLNLYPGERNRKPLEDVIEDMKTKGLKVEVLKDRGGAALRISFGYPDRYKAQRVVNAVAQKVIDAASARWEVSPATLPDVPVAPDRLAYTALGLVAGLITGVVASLIWWRAKWTFKLMGFGLAGCVIAGAAALLIPNRYTSRSTLRVIPAPKADGERRYMQEAEMSDWLRRKEREILSDESLGEIIQRRAIDLYRKQREEKPVEAAIAIMRQNLKVEAPHSHSAFTISFTYPDRFKAQAVVSALVTKFTDSEFVITEADLMAYHPRQHTDEECIGKTGDEYVDCITGHLGNIFPAVQALRRRKSAESIDVLDAASLPETPVAPNRFLLAGAGLFAGLFLGSCALRRKPAVTLGHAS